VTVTAAGDHGGSGASALGLHVVRHELKNALSAASMHLELLARSRGPEVARDRIEAVRDALDQALGLSERLTGEQAAGTAACCEIGLLVRQCVRLARPLIERRGELVQSLPSYVGEIALGEIETRELLLNLLINAGQALTVAGHVRVSARVVDGRVLLVVEDDGVGMSEETLERAFVSGFSSKPDGTGYGLPRVQDLVEKVGGQVRVQSSPGLGTRVELELPLAGFAKPLAPAVASS
jgi:signal transduction histidine kinase